VRTRPVPLQRQERPRERLLRDGADTLSVAELLAIVFGTGRVGAPSISVATELLASFGSLERIARAGNAELAGVAGLGPAKTAALRAAFELGSRLLRQPLQPGDRFHSPDQVFAHFGARLRRLRQEVFFSILLDSRHRLLREVEVSRGSLNQSLVHPREVFGPALREAAAAIVVLHNHPSGDPTPSREDHEVTRRLVRAGEILGVRLLDHVVIGFDGYTSFAQRGWLDAQDPGGRSR
jgi:DNA repair protein RadC